MKVKTLSASETAYFLRAKLGDVRAWDDLLADMRRGRAGYHAEVLLPVGRYSATRHPRPVYLFSEVCEFVEKVSRLCPPPPSRTCFLCLRLTLTSPISGIGAFALQ